MKKGFLFRRKIVPERSEGFTLVEMLVVIAVLSIFGVLFLTIFTRSLKGGNKSQMIGRIKQNGQAVLEVMDKTVRDADNVICPKFTDSTFTTTSSDTLVVIKNGQYTRFRLIPPGSSAGLGDCGLANLNGCILEDFPVQPVDRRLKSFLIDNICTDQIGTDSLTTQIITDTNNQTGVSVNCSGSGCSANPGFTRDRLVGTNDQITIKFVINPPRGASAALVGQIDAISFQTTVQLR